MSVSGPGATSLGGTLIRRRCAGTTGRGTLATAPARCRAVACAMSVPDGAVAAAADPAAAGLLAPFLFRPRAATAAAGAVPPAGPLRAPLVEASRGPSPSAGTVSGAAAGCPAPLAPGRRPAAAREGWIGRRDGRQSLMPFAGTPGYALK